MRHAPIFAFALALSSSAALAQPAPQQQQPQQQGPSLKRLHDALRLTPQQEPAWQAYTASIAPDPQQQGRSRQAQMMMPTLPTPRRLALMRAQMQSDLAVFDRDAQAVTAFYNLLSPEQQRVFDTQTAPTNAPR